MIIGHTHTFLSWQETGWNISCEASIGIVSTSVGQQDPLPGLTQEAMVHYEMVAL